MKHLPTNQKLEVLASCLEFCAIASTLVGEWPLGLVLIAAAAIVSLVLCIRVRRARNVDLENIRQRWINLLAAEREAKRADAIVRRPPIALSPPKPMTEPKPLGAVDRLREAQSRGDAPEIRRAIDEIWANRARAYEQRRIAAEVERLTIEAKARERLAISPTTQAEGTHPPKDTA